MSTTIASHHLDKSDASSKKSSSEDSSEDSDSSESKPVKSSCSRAGTASSLCKKKKSRDAFENTCGIPAGNTIFRDSNDVAFVLSQHHHYLHRVNDWNATLADRGNGAQTSDLMWWYMHARGKNDPDWRMYQRVKGLHDFTLTECVRHIEVVETLLKHGASVNLQNDVSMDFAFYIYVVSYVYTGRRLRL